MAGALKKRRGARFRRQMGEINVTPFVDVTLVLLIVFMVAAPLMTVGVPVDLPKTEAKSLPNNQEPLSITVLSDGRIFLQKDEIPEAEILPRLRAIAGDNNEQRIFIRGEGNADYAMVMQVMARINAAGFRNIGLVTDPISK
jgi:biopolymer transport protein TolR